MNEKLTFSLDDNNILWSGADGLAPQKGSESLPYTVSEYEDLVESGEWNGGFVERLGMVESQSMPSDGTDGYYSDWDFDISEYIGSDERTPKYNGSKKAKENKKDCGYCCIATFLDGIGSTGVGDLYGDWLKARKGVSAKKVNTAISEGLVIGYIGDFLTDVLPKFGKKVENVDVYIKGENEKREYWYQRGPEKNGEFNLLGTIEIEKNKTYHEVIMKGVYDNGNTIYFDPQNPYSKAEYPCGKIVKLFRVSDR